MAIFGNNVYGGTTYPGGSGRCLTSFFQLTQPGSITSLSGYIAGTAVGEHVKFVILSNSSGNLPQTLLAVTPSIVTTGSNGYLTGTLSSAVVLSPGTYWLGIVSDTQSGNTDYGTTQGTSATTVMANGTFTFASPPSTWPGTDATYASADVDVYATYTAATAITAASVNTAGTQLTVTTNNAVNFGAGGNGGVVLAGGAAITATYSGGTGTTSLVYSLSRLVSSTETLTFAYTQPGTGMKDASTNTDVPSTTNLAVTNGSTVVGPAITGVSSATPRYNSSLTITGTAFNSTQSTGTVTIGAVAQTVTAWSDTSITVTVARGTNKYGTALNILVRNGVTTLTSAVFSLTNILPQTGWAFVNIGTPNATTSLRLTSTADLASGDQIAYQAVTGTGGVVTVASDGSWSSPSDVTSFPFEVWTNTTDGWGTTATQTIGSGGPAAQASYFNGLAKASIASICGFTVGSISSRNGFLI